MVRKLFDKIWARIDVPEAIVVTGMRRVGKTTLLRQVYDKIPSSNKIFLDLENPLNQKYFEQENYENIKYQFELLGINSSEKAYIFLDEIQFARNIPSVVKYLLDHYKYKFFLTGSASFYLKNLFSESLAGRKIIYELFPLGFHEYLDLKGQKLKIPQDGVVNEQMYQTIMPLYREYVEFGGFPEVINKKTREEKKEALGDILSSYFNKEVVGIGEFRNNQVVRDLILLLSSRIGSKIDVQKISAELGVTRVTINQYLAFLEGTYFVTTISPFTSGRDVEVRAAKKVYLCDSGLASSLGKIDFGAVFENAIFTQLRELGEVNYYQKKNGQEIDFVLNKSGGWEVKVKANKQDLKKLTKLTIDLGLTEKNLVSYEYVKDLSIKYGFQL